MTKILHIIQGLSLGGAARALVAAAKYSSQLGNFRHSVVSLLPAMPDALALANEAGIDVITAPKRDTILKEMEKADIVHLNFWNNPQIYELLRLDLPEMRLLIWVHIAGDKPPQILTQKLIDFADFMLACSPYTYQHPAIQNLPDEALIQKTGMVYGAADFARLADIRLRPHDTFNVGYIGSIDFTKMHGNYVSMSAAAAIPDVKFIVCGDGIQDFLAQQTQQLGVADRFDFRGYVKDIKKVIEILDVYGYPLCEDTYAAAELNLQEVMYAGVPPVVFPYGGLKHLVIHEFTGLVVRNEWEYKQALEHLYHHPEERSRLGKNAGEYAKQIFGAENAAKKLNPIYEKMMLKPKRKRTWGARCDVPLIYQPVSIGDLSGQREEITGARAFIESLGENAEHFLLSMDSQDISAVFAAEKKISKSSPVLQSPGGGGIFHYRYYYPHDAFLSLWTGLVLQEQGRYREALSEYASAIRNGLNHWRCFLYIAHVAERAGNVPLAKEARERVHQMNPAFDENTLLASPQDAPSAKIKGEPRDTSFTVSAIVSTYNSERFIRGCLEDLVSQTLYEKGELEIIVVDSGSQQNEEAIVKEFQAHYSNIYYVNTKHRETIYAAWNKGIKQAKGHYITNANTDDRHRKDALEVMAHVLDEHPEIALVYGDLMITKIENETFDGATPSAYFKLPEFDRNILLHRQCIGPQPMWRRSLHDELGYFTEDFKVAGDYEWWLRISEKYQIKHIPELLGLYLWNESGVEHSNRDLCQQESAVIRKHYMEKAGTTPRFELYCSDFVVPQYDGPQKKEDASPAVALHNSRLRVSAIVSTHNAENFIRGCLEDLVNQTLYKKGGLEIIVVDSGSGQNEKAIVEEFRKTYKNILYLRTGRETVYGAWNRGIKLASGTYITNANTDDRHRKDALEVMADMLDKRPDIGLVYADAIITDTANETFENHSGTGIYQWLDFSRELLALSCFIGPQSMWRKSLHDKYGYFNETFSSSGDWEFWLRIAEDTSFLHISELLGLYFRSPKSLERRNASQRMKEDRLIYQKYIPKYLSDYREYFREYFAGISGTDQPDPAIVYRYGQILTALGHDDEAGSVFASYLQNHPEDRVIVSLLEELINRRTGSPDHTPLRAFSPASPLKVSAIVSTFNSEQFIMGCLEDLVNQTLYRKGELEIIVVNSGSQENEEAVVKEFQTNYPNIRFIKTDERETVYAAWNRGIAAATGEYITNANTDDRHRGDALEIMAKELDEHTDIALVCADSIITKIENETFNRCTPAGYFALPEYDRIHLLHGSCIGPQPMWRKSLHDEMGYFDETLKVAGDYEWWLRVSEKYPFRHIPELLGLYLMAPRSVEHSDEQASLTEAFSVRDRYVKKAGIRHDFTKYGKPFVTRQYPPEKTGDTPEPPAVPADQQKNPSFAAVYCVYDDTDWLRESVESVYSAVDAIYFLVSNRPWHGQPTDNRATLALISMLPDPLDKIKVIGGAWTNETDQRNAGLDLLKKAGFAYCFVIDADEIYDAAELKKMIGTVVSRPDVDCWHISLDTYWKAYHYRIEPREPLTPPVFVKTGDIRFTLNRLASGKNHMLIPPETGICHHLSYARSDEEILKKIASFSHAHEVKPGWFENVWKRWDADHSMTDLHPTHPHNYQLAVEQPYSALPPVLQRRYLADEHRGSGGDIISGLTSIIILAHNRWDQTARCLKSIERHTPEPHEIIVVDNGSTDETRERLRELMKEHTRITPSPLPSPARGEGIMPVPFLHGEEAHAPTPRSRENVYTPPLTGGEKREGVTNKHFNNNKSMPHLTVIANATNLGYAAGNNQGISIARGEYILLLNNDTIVTPGWLGRLIDVFKRHPKTGIAGPLSNNVTRPQAVENVGYEDGTGIDDFARKWSEEHERLSFTTTKASGFCLFIRREVIDSIGGLDEQFGSGNFEDDDFCSRAFLTGFDIRIAQDVFIHHEGKQTFKSSGIDYNAKMAHNWELYKAKWEIPKDTPMDRYWVPSRIPESMSHFFPLPDLSSSHRADSEKQWWKDIKQTDKQTEKQQLQKKQRTKNMTSIIILLSGRREYATRCIESIQKHTKEPHELIFIFRDTSFAPPKWLRKMLKENKHYRLIQDSRGLASGESPGRQGVKDSREKKSSKRPQPRYTEPWSPPADSSPEPLSYAQACNRGMAEAKGEYLVLLDDSVVVTEDWLSGMLECLKGSPDTGIVGPLGINVEGQQGIEIRDSRLGRVAGATRGRGVKDSSEIQKSVIARSEATRQSQGQGKDELAALPPVARNDEHKTLTPEEINEYAKSFREKNRYRRVRVKALNSLCLLFPHALTEKAGLFDETFRTDEYAADDFCIRSAVEGLGNYIAGDVLVHLYGRTSLPALKDRITFSRKWSEIDDSRPESKKAYCANALFLADELHQKGQKERAVVTLSEEIKSYPNEKRRHYALAEMLIGDKNYKDALDVLERMPGGFRGEARWLELSGYCAEGLGRNEEAEQYADAIIASDSSSSKAWNLKGAVAFKKNLSADAEKFFMRAIESDRGFGEAYANLGALRWVSGKREEALTLFERAFVLSPSVADIVTNYYTAVVTLSKLPEAEKLFREAVPLYPFNRRLKFILIDNLLQQGKYPEAMDEMEEALAVFGVDDDTLAVALKLRERLQDSRIQGGKGPSEELKENLPTSRTLESSNPRTLSFRTLSLCMIVKNEEKNIIRALQGAKPLVDEMVVVDTGSADRTKKIATAFGAKVYDFRWNDSFSDARNFSLSKATGDWILVLDADEVVSARDYGKLRKLISINNSPLEKGDKGGCITQEQWKSIQPPAPPFLRGNTSEQGFRDSSENSSFIPHPSSPVAFSFTTRNYVGPISINWTPNDGQYKEEAGSGWFPSVKVRLFPNDNRIRFERNVHEIVEDSLKRIGAEIKPCDIPIHHYGKLNREDIRAKGEDYYQLGKKKLALQGEENANALFELAMQASELEKNDEAVDLWKKLVRLRPGLEKGHYGLGTCYFRLGRYEEARAAFARAIQVGHGSKDQIVMYASSELLMGDADAAVLLLEALLKEDPSYPLALLGITAAYFCTGRKDKGRESASKVGDTQFSLATYLTDIAKLLISVNRFDYARTLLDAAVETGDATDEIWQDPRIQGVKDSRGTEKKKLLTPLPPNLSPSFVETTRPLESLNPRPLSSASLSLCMIVKDEEENIEQALMSVRPVVDEMIVVDTGSTDRTKEIAGALGAKVYDFKWTDNFSDARNFSLSKATGDWILVLDADEMISALDYEKLKELVRQDSRIQGFKDSSEERRAVIARSEATKQSQGPEKDGIAALPPVARNDEHTASAPRILESSNPVSYSFVTRTYVTQMNTAGWAANDGKYRDEEAGAGWFPGEKVRLFPNDPRFRFEYALHERIEPSLTKAGVKIKPCDIPVHHYGNFAKKEKQEFKTEQYYQLAKRKLAESGEDNYMAYYEIALLGTQSGKYEETISYLKKAIALKPDFSRAYQSLGNAYYNLRTYNEALSSYKKALELRPDPRDVRDARLMHATCEILTGNAEKAVALVEAFLKSDASYPQAIIILTEAYICAGSKAKGLENVKKLMALNFDCGSLFNNFAKMLISAGRHDYAALLLEAAVEGGFATDETRRLLEGMRKK